MTLLHEFESTAVMPPSVYGEERSRQQFARAQELRSGPHERCMQAVLFQEDLSVLLLAAVSQQPHVSSSSSRYKKVVRASAKCQARTH